MGTVISEIVKGRDFGVQIDEEALSIKTNVRGICELLGFDPLYVANEGKVVMIVGQEDARSQEPLFIKNLENVQGDERDVIFVSMTYGPQTPGGRVFQRFGPINSDVGWRRLNVLFTRSKKRMHIFSSMGSEDIIAGSASKRGVHALHDFLVFCETGILHKTEREVDRPPDSDFEIAVMAALRDEGFECVPQVGVAGFFIDVSVLDPGNPGRYLMGIECDGARKTATV